MKDITDVNVVPDKTVTFTAAELMEMELPEPKWAIPGIIPEGQTILAGNPKLGKSWLALNLSVAIASGGKALGGVPVEAGDVLYLALEDNRRRLKERLTAVSGGNSASDRLTLSISWPRLDAGGLEKMEHWITEHPEARLIIIDTFKKVRPLRKGRTNMYVEDYDDVGILKDLADTHRIAIVAVHHTNKAVADDPIEAVSGSFGLTGATDGILILKRERGQHDATLLVTGRDTEEQEIALKWDQDSCNWLMLGDAANFRVSEGRAAIIKCLEENGAPMGPTEIASLLGKSEVAVRRTLSRMAKDGQIKSIGGGKYTTISHTSHESHKDIETDDSLSESASHKNIENQCDTVTDGTEDDNDNDIDGVNEFSWY